MHFVADTCGLVILAAAEKRTVGSIGIILGLWTASECGVGLIYNADVAG
jgi:hypothetical protein